MQRPNASRRLRPGAIGRRAIDRRVAAGCFLVAAIVMLVTVVFASAPVPETDRRDPAAARDLVALMRAGERGHWIASYDFTRTLENGRALRERMREGRTPALHVVINGSAMTVEHRDRTYECNLLHDRSGCQQATVGTSLPASEVLRIAVAAGAYSVVDRPGETIAGMQARCFRARATGRGGLPGLGVETEQCFAADGVPLRQVVVRAPGVVDEQVATSVRRRVTTGAVDALAKTFAPKPAGTQR